LDVVPITGTGLNNQSVNATCSGPVNGPGLVSVSGGASVGVSQFAMYPTIDRGFYLIELDGGATGTSGASGAGVAFQQTPSIQQILSGPSPASAFNGSSAFDFFANTALGSQNLSGQIVSDGVSAITGALNVNSFNTTATPPAAAPSSGATLSGSYTASAAGRFPMTLMITPANGQPTPQITTLHSACYVVDASTCLLLGLDATAPGTGAMPAQNTGL
jgi:hypothetical protein